MTAPTAQRFVCIHGHFYQPPRENPWLETLEVQDSAAPYHDWNDRVTAECYAPNAAARLLDAPGYITALRNNYEHISFNFGPTLMAWMAQARPHVAAQILRADQESCRRFGRGNAVAQVYGHCIMPLASPRDQRTQVRWGIADFVHRFGRPPDGMWLPETAVDRSTLAVLAEHGIRFTILAPSQAARVRYGDGAWEPVRGGGLDCARAYRCVTAPGKEIVLFFYDGDIAHSIAFGGLLNDGRELARRLTAAALARDGSPLVHVATDGESYGHHHRFGEMALAAALETLEHDAQVRLTNYAAYLDQVAVRDEVEIHENSAWSCAHGIERWRSNCGCNAGHAGWQQTWRTPLRESLDWLKHKVDALFERHGALLLRDPWAARDAYIDVVLQRDRAHRDAFIDRHGRRRPHGEQRTQIWKLLELQRHALLSFTSCGWFFDEPSGIETVQVLSYAARAIQLAAELGAALEPGFLQRLKPLRSNLPQYANGAQLYRQLVHPQVTDAQRLVAHYAMDTLLTPPPAEVHTYAHRFAAHDRTLEHGGTATLGIGRVRLTSDVTEEGGDYAYAALHLGGHDMHCSVSASPTADDYTALQDALRQTFLREPVSALVRRMDQAFGNDYTLRDVFVAERRRILGQVTAQVTKECTETYERLVTTNRRLLDFLAQVGVPLPDELRVAATFVLQRRLEHAAAAVVAGELGADAVLTVCAAAERWGIDASSDGARAQLDDALRTTMLGLDTGPTDAVVARAHAILDLAQAVPVALNLWEAQNHYYDLITTGGARSWTPGVLAELRRLGERLRFHLREWETLAPRAA